jgi:fluoride exporter
MIRNLLLVGLGGGLGSMARYICQKWLNTGMAAHFPLGTFAVNIVGCLAIGILWGISFKSFDSNEQWKLLLMVGLCGGFTTFSAFTLEGIGLLRENRISTFFLYMAGSVITGLLATWLGMRLIR